MCGIAGYSSLGTGQDVDPSLIDGMLDCIRHRGPDDQGKAVFSKLAMGNTRLSIIDIEGGHQPISNEDGSVTVVFNGEIYNSPELRKELLVCGHQFSTKSDTEVLVHLYEEEGVDFLKRLNGMFGLALYDQKNNKLIVARDRFGVKPLFWSYREGKLSFASELKSIKTLPDFDPELDPEGLSVFLGLFYIPDPWTIYRHVHRLRPGHCLVLSDSGLEDIEYFDLDYKNKQCISSKEAEDKAAELLRRAVKRQLLSDVPVGVLLSGGLDSRAVLASAADVNKNTEAFTITFDEPSYNEEDIAAAWANLHGCKHHRMLFDEEDFCSQYINRQRELDEPYALWCNVATAKLSKYIHNTGFKVVLSGEGGDESFLGYPTIHAANIFRYYQMIPSLLRNKVIKPLVNMLPAGSSRLPFTFKLKSFVNADSPDLIRTFFGFKEVIRYQGWQALLTPAAYKMVGDIDPYIAFKQYSSKIRSLSFVDGLSYLDFKVFLPGSSFFGNDNAFMSASVETRVPFMDNDLVDFSCSLPTSVRFNAFKPKVLLKRALSRHFQPPPGPGSEKVKKYKKLGFEVPGNIWIQNERFSGLVKNVLSKERVERTNFFRAEVVEQLLTDHLMKRNNNERILQAMMSLILFLDDAYDELS
jgi:asparagine synthase (glutamine-hydrolysing)